MKQFFQNLETICQSSDEGKKFWSLKDKKFDQDERILLAKVITQYFFDIGNGSISMQMFMEMVTIIKQQFPTEVPNTWYIPPNNKVQARGLLVTPYRNLQGHRRQQFGPQKGKRAIKHHTVTKHDKMKEQASQFFSELSEEQKNACTSKTYYIFVVVVVFCSISVC